MVNVFFLEGVFKFCFVVIFGFLDEIICFFLIFFGFIFKKKFVKENCNYRILKYGYILFFVVKVNFKKIFDILSV